MKLTPVQTINYNNYKKSPNFRGWVEFNNALVNSNNIESVQISRKNNKAFIVTTSGGYLNTDAEYKYVKNCVRDASKSYSIVVPCNGYIITNGSIRKHISVDNNFLRVKTYDSYTDVDKAIIEESEECNV